jgi:LytR cell envelope-related transcriptional attenuator
MSVIQEPGSTRPGRAAGLLLIGVAVIAVVLGVITLLNGDEDNNQGAPPPSSTGQQPPPPPPSGPGGQPSGSQPPGNQPPPPPSTSQAPPPPVITTTTPPPEADTKSVKVRVFNNSTIEKFAATAARDFRETGWDVVEVGNYSESIIPTTTAYFRPGTPEEAAAKAIAFRFNMKSAPRLPNFRFGDGVLVMITKDYGSK